MRDALAAYPCVDVRLGLEFVAASQDADGVTMEARDGDGATQRFTVDYLIGCDGASSAVRRAAGLSLDDLGFDEPWLVVDILVKEKGLAKLPRNSAQYCNATRPTTYLIGPKNLRRWEITILPGEDPKAIEREENVWPLLAQWLTPDDGEMWRASSYRFHALVANRWRNGRIFIAGIPPTSNRPSSGRACARAFAMR